jgi:hypothetical protein
MLTRKRLRDENQRNLVKTEYYSFDPIMEAVARFLGFQDCGNVAKMNREFAHKLWVYVLRSSSRVSEIICFHSSSYVWISKYSKELKNIKLHVGSHHASFSSLEIPQLYSLQLMCCRVPIRLPPKIIDLTMLDALGYLATLSSFPCVTSLNIGDIGSMGFHYLKNLPSSLEILSLWLSIFSCRDLPFLPRLESLLIRQCGFFEDIAELRTKCPNLVHLELCNVSLNGLQGLDVHKLVLLDTELVDISDLAHIRVDVLDLSRCPNVVDFSSVKHISRVIKAKQ